MNSKELYNQLIAAYSDKNLNRITGKLIELYKNRHYKKIREIADMISEYVTIDAEQDAKCFSKLVFLYHPDRGKFFRDEIQQLRRQNEPEKLTRYSHILLMRDIETFNSAPFDDAVDYTPEYEWDEEQSGYYTYSDLDETIDETQIYDEVFEKTFYDEVKLRMFGDLSKEFPPYYLEDYEVFEFAASEITSLDGVQYCKHVITIDLSNNEITDISDLRELGELQELYLANNQIGYIDALSSLLKLKIVDLSGNQIDDISPLYELENLEYVNLIGNSIPAIQIKKLQANKIIITY